MKIGFSDEDYQVGDKCLVSNGMGGGQLATVAKLTKTQVVLSNGQRFNDRGFLIGGGTWSRVTITKDPKAFKDYRNRKDMLKLERYMEKIRKMPPELVEQILKFVDEHPLYQPLKDVN